MLNFKIDHSQSELILTKLLVALSQSNLSLPNSVIWCSWIFLFVMNECKPQKKFCEVIKVLHQNW